MHLIRGIHNLFKLHANSDIQKNGSVITIGNFDGVHLGHQSILKQIRQITKKIDVVSCVILFEPQPREFFARQNPPSRINSLRDKLAELKKFNLDYCLCLKFNQQFANLSALSFVENVLVKNLNVKHLIIGKDFHFGKNRMGNYDFLCQQGKIHDFTVSTTEDVKFKGKRISSTEIRQQLQNDNLQTAKELLGHSYSIAGRVIHGQKLARTLGFPTANLSLLKRKLPINGVFAVKAIIDNKSYLAIANVGNRPTLTNDLRQHLEVHLIDFSGNLYGKRVQVVFEYKIRDEQKFANLEELKSAISKDVLLVKNSQ